MMHVSFKLKQETLYMYSFRVVQIVTVRLIEHFLECDLYRFIELPS